VNCSIHKKMNSYISPTGDTLLVTRELFHPQKDEILYFTKR